MNDALDKLQHTLDRQMGLLARHLRTPAPRPEAIRRVRSAVAREAAQVERQAHRLRLIRRWAAAAAAVLLAIGLGWPPATEQPGNITPGDPAEMLAEWTGAVDESSNQIAALLSGDWLPDKTEATGNEERQLEDLLDSLDQSRALLQGA
jgi:hypothetical protein